MMTLGVCPQEHVTPLSSRPMLALTDALFAWRRVDWAFEMNDFVC